jgi:hypothetical protein
VEKDQSGGGDVTDSPRTQADSPQRLVTGFEQRVSAFSDSAFGVVGVVGVLLLVGE